MMLSSTSKGFPSVTPSVTVVQTERTSINGSEQTLQEAFEMEIRILKLLSVIVALVGLPGNMVVLWLLGFCIQRNAFSVYVLNLAAADFLLLCCYIIHAVKMLIKSFFSFSIHIPQFFIIMLVFAYVTGLSILGAISTERCLSVLWPIWYRCRRPRHMSGVMCSLLWALSLILSCLEGNYCGFLIRNYHDDLCQVIDYITFTWLILLFVLLCGTSLALLTRLLCGSQRVQLTQLYVTVMLTVLAFLLCGLPFGIHWFLVIWFQEDFAAYVHSYLVTGLLSCVNSCANPIIYFFVGSFRQRWWKRRQSLRLVLQRALQRALQDTPKGDEHGESLPQETLEMSGSSLVS